MNKIILALCTVLAFTILVSNYSESIQADLAHNMVRFHVVANSDAPEDQALKHSVKDKIIDSMKELFDETENIDATKETINKNIPKIKAIAEEEIKKWGKNYDVKVTLGVYPFPTKVYGDVTLPAGNYEALRVVIGEGSGENWWCVLFPPLCFVDATQGELPEASKEKLKSVLTEEEYEIITSAHNDGELPVQIKFKIIELWQNSKLKIQTALNKKN